MNNVIMSGLLYKSWSWLRVSMTVIVEFHPMRVGVLDTLNHTLTFSSMWKHACAMFLKDKK